VAGLALLLVVAFGAGGAEVNAANPPPPNALSASDAGDLAQSTDRPSQSHDIYQVLEDGSIIVTRTRLSSEKALQATQECTKTPPILSEPANGAQLDTLAPEYYYLQNSETSRYHIQVSASETFAETVLDINYSVSNPISGQRSRIHSFNNLAPNTTYYWRMNSRCEDWTQGEYSPVWSFRSGPSGGTILPAPALLAPDDGASVGSVRVTFVAEQVSGAERHQFRWYDSDPADWDDWSHLVFINWNPPVFWDTFDPQETLYWRVVAGNSYAWGTPSATRSFTTPPVTATTTISPDSGGTLTPDPGDISIQFPHGAVTDTTTLSYTLQPRPSQSLANFRFAGRAFTLEAFDAHGQPVTTFNQPFTLTIVYDGFDLFAAGIDNPSKLNLAFWNGSEWEWILPCAGCSVDTENHTVIAVVDHLTEFALFAPRERLVFLPVVLEQMAIDR
jgi:hypothetical protein